MGDPTKSQKKLIDCITKIEDDNILKATLKVLQAFLRSTQKRA